MTDVIAYMLITVTFGGAVHRSEEFADLRMCEEAKSLATTGATIEENARIRAEQAKRKEERHAAWLAAHPARPPTAKDRKACYKAGTGVITSDPFCVIEKDGLTHEYEGQHLVFSNDVLFGSADALRVAECVATHQGAAK